VRPLRERERVLRLLALLLALTTFLPWLTSRGLVDEDQYSGNPLPLVDWVVVGSALSVALLPRLGKVAAVVGAVSVSLAVIALYLDRAEGLRSSAEYGLAIAALVSALLWLMSGPVPQTGNETIDGKRLG
jgi:hypothetical protein